MKQIIFLLLSILLLVMGCSKESSETRNSVEPLNVELTKSEMIVVEKNANFSLGLLKELDSSVEMNNKNKGNVFVSPYSINAVLSVLANGAVGNSAQEIYNLLGWGESDVEPANSYYETMNKHLLSLDHNTSISVANSFWYNTALDLGSIQAGFADAGNKYYDIYFEGLDFRKDDAKNRINKWSSKQTNGTIPEILEFVSPASMLYLLNSVYFESSWNSSIKFENSRGSFASASGNVSIVKKIKTEELIGYANEVDAEFVSIPFGNKAFSFVGILPSKDLKMSELISRLQSENKLYEVLQELKRDENHEVKLTMPEIKMEQHIELVSILRTLGVEEVFSNDAKLWNIFENVKSSSDNLYLDRMFQKSYFSLDKEGVKAAATTVVGGLLDSSMPEKVTIDFDRPYMFFIVENSTNTILFEGIVKEI